MLSLTKAPFSKYSGCGNDFIILDNRESFFSPQNTSLISKLCDRRRGIGADGLILLENSEKAPFRMRHFNSDGKEASMCGNGIRCFFAFICQKEPTLKSTEIEVSGQIFFVNSVGSEIQVDMPPPQKLKWNFEINGYSGQFHHLNTGVPHLVHFTQDLDSIPLADWGPRLRNHPQFAQNGVNVNFASVKEKSLKMRTYERGVEGETLACGTGATAVALAANHTYQLESPIQVEQRSGEILTISFEKQKNTYENIKMQGPATLIYEGYVEI